LCFHVLLGPPAPDPVSFEERPVTPPQEDLGPFHGPKRFYFFVSVPPPPLVTSTASPPPSSLLGPAPSSRDAEGYPPLPVFSQEPCFSLSPASPSYGPPSFLSSKQAAPYSFLEDTPLRTKSSSSEVVLLRLSPLRFASTLKGSGLLHRRIEQWSSAPVFFSPLLFYLCFEQLVTSTLVDSVPVKFPVSKVWTLPFARPLPGSCLERCTQRLVRQFSFFPLPGFFLESLAGL